MSVRVGSTQILLPPRITNDLRHIQDSISNHKSPITSRIDLFSITMQNVIAFVIGKVSRRFCVLTRVRKGKKTTLDRCIGFGKQEIVYCCLNIFLFDHMNMLIANFTKPDRIEFRDLTLVICSQWKTLKFNGMEIV